MDISTALGLSRALVYLSENRVMVGAADARQTSGAPIPASRRVLGRSVWVKRLDRFMLNRP